MYENVAAEKKMGGQYGTEIENEKKTNLKKKRKLYDGE